MIIAFAYLLWSDGTSDRAESTIELVTDDSPAEPMPVQVVASVVGEDTIVHTNYIDNAPSNELPEGLAVQGSVKDQLRQGISNMRIEITPKDSLSGEKNVYTTTTDHRGEFRFESIPPGNNYRLEVLASGAYLGIFLDPVAVNIGMPLVIITLDSVELVTIDGMIVDVDNAPVPNFEILIQNVGLAYPGRKIRSDSSGFFRLAQFPTGELQLSTSGAEHFKISGITLNSDVYRNLTLVLDKGAYHLSGWVSGEFGAPIAQARVTLTSNFNREDYSSSSFRLRVTDSNGGFAFVEIGGQDHLLSIDAIGYESKEINYRFQFYSDDMKINLLRK